jgi:hypothetical protein
MTWDKSYGVTMCEQNNGAAMNGECNGKATDGRDSAGRFAAGNRGGPGNPFARQAAAFRKAIQSAVSAEDMADFARVVRAKALGGDLSAIRLLFSYGAGRPGPAPDPDTLDAHELAVRRGSTASPEDMKALFESVPASLVCAIASVVAPVIQAHLEKQFADGVRRQGELEQEGRQSSPEAPGPYPGWKADWAPKWLKEGRMPEAMEELFYSCPAWAPDFHGTDRAQHAYGDMLQALRKDLLSNMGDERRWLSETDCHGEKRTGPAAAPAAGGRGSCRAASHAPNGAPVPAERGSPSRPGNPDGDGCRSMTEAATKRDKTAGLRLADLLGPDALF